MAPSWVTEDPKVTWSHKIQSWFKIKLPHSKISELFPLYSEDDIFHSLNTQTLSPQVGGQRRSEVKERTADHTDDWHCPKQTWQVSNADSCSPASSVAMIMSWTVLKKIPLVWAIHIFLLTTSFTSTYQILIYCSFTALFLGSPSLWQEPCWTEKYQSECLWKWPMPLANDFLNRVHKRLIDNISWGHSSFHLGCRKNVAPTLTTIKSEITYNIRTFLEPTREQRPQGNKVA